MDRIFESAGLSFIPSVVRYGLVALFVLSPVIGICYVLCFEEDPDIEAAKKRVTD